MSVIYARNCIPKSKYNLKNQIKVKPKYINNPTKAMVLSKNAPITLANYKPKPPTPGGDTLRVSTNHLRFIAAGETKQLGIETNLKWIIR